MPLPRPRPSIFSPILGKLLRYYEGNRHGITIEESKQRKHVHISSHIFGKGETYPKGDPDSFGESKAHLNISFQIFLEAANALTLQCLLCADTF